MKTTTITLEYRLPGESSTWSDEDQEINYADTDVPIKVGTHIGAIDLLDFYRALDKDDPLREELRAQVVELQNLRNELASE